MIPEQKALILVVYVCANLIFGIYAALKANKLLKKQLDEIEYFAIGYITIVALIGIPLYLYEKIKKWALIR